MIAEAYVENDVLSQDGMELVCLLYAKALEKISEAGMHLEAQRIKERASAIGDAMAIVVELQSSLDLDRGGELARTLADLYAYIQQRLIEANAEQAREPLEEAGRLLGTLYEGWLESRETKLSATSPTASPDSARTDSQSTEEIAPAARSWTL